MGERGSRLYARLGSSLDEGKEGGAMFEVVLFQETKTIDQREYRNERRNGRLSRSPMITRSRVVFLFSQKVVFDKSKKKKKMGGKERIRRCRFWGQW